MAGPIGFTIRLATIVVVLTIALRVVGLQPTTVAIGGAATTIVFGLAAQQTLGNVFAGIVLLGARPFRVAERIRLQGGVLAGQIEGVVVDSGLLYTTLARGEDKVSIPNGVVLNCAVVPLPRTECSRRAGASPARDPAQRSPAPSRTHARHADTFCAADSTRGVQAGGGRPPREGDASRRCTGTPAHQRSTCGPPCGRTRRQ